MLPKVEVPIFEVKLPSTGESLKFRPWLAKEEKILLMALTGSDEREMVIAVKNVIKACIVNNVDMEKFSSFDLEYFFVKLRAKSAGEMITLHFSGKEDAKCEKCKEPQSVDVDLNEVQVEKNPEHSNRIDLDGKIGVIMRYPRVGDTGKSDLNLDESTIETLFENIAKCIEQIFTDSDVVDVSLTPLNEKVDWVGSLPKAQFAKLMTFFKTMPTLKHEIKIKCPACGTEESFVVEGLKGFFA